MGTVELLYLLSERGDMVRVDRNCWSQNHTYSIHRKTKMSNGIFGKHKYITDRAELVVDSPQANYAIHAKKELRYLSIRHSARGGWVIPPLVFYKYR